MQRSFMTSLLLMAALCVTTVDLGAHEGKAQSRKNVPVQVRYAMRALNSKSWSMASAPVVNAASEKMILNQLKQRHPNKEILVLGVKINNKSTRALVKYQVQHKNSASSATGSVMLYDVLNENMAKNQLELRHPGSKVRILSMLKQ